MPKNDQYYIEKIIEEIDTIIFYSKQLPLNNTKQYNVVLDGIIFRMIQMSEHLGNISEEFKLTHPEIMWTLIKGFRNRLVHDYGGVDLEFVENVIKKDIYVLRDQLIKYCQ